MPKLSAVHRELYALDLSSFSSEQAVSSLSFSYAEIENIW